LLLAGEGTEVATALVGGAVGAEVGVGAAGLAHAAIKMPIAIKAKTTLERMLILLIFLLSHRISIAWGH
jgi:uncharacterized RmlC-like cupin family protein